MAHKVHASIGIMSAEPDLELWREMQRAKSEYAAARSAFDVAVENGEQGEIKRASNEVSTALKAFGHAKFRYEESVRTSEHSA